MLGPVSILQLCPQHIPDLDALNRLSVGDILPQVGQRPIPRSPSVFPPLSPTVYSLHQLLPSKLEFLEPISEEPPDSMHCPLPDRQASADVMYYPPRDCQFPEPRNFPGALRMPSPKSLKADGYHYLHGAPLNSVPPQHIGMAPPLGASFAPQRALGAQDKYPPPSPLNLNHDSQPSNFALRRNVTPPSSELAHTPPPPGYVPPIATIVQCTPLFPHVKYGDFKPLLSSKTDWGLWLLVIHNMVTNSGIYSHICDDLLPGEVRDHIEDMPSDPPILPRYPSQAEYDWRSDWWWRDRQIKQLMLSTVSVAVQSSIPDTQFRPDGTHATACHVYCSLRHLYSNINYNSAIQAQKEVRNTKCGTSPANITKFVLTWRCCYNTIQAA